MTTDATKSQSNGVLLTELVSSAHRADQAFASLPRLLLRVLEAEAWLDFTIEETDEGVAYGRTEFEKFVETPAPRGLGLTMDRLVRMVFAIGGPDADVALRLVLELVQPIATHGGARQKFQGHNVTLPGNKSRRGNSPIYKLKRLKATRPDLAQRVINGELSANEAGIEAGIPTPSHSSAQNPTKATAKIRQSGPDTITEERPATSGTYGPITEVARIPAVSELATTSVMITLPLASNDGAGPVHETFTGFWLIPPSAHLRDSGCRELPAPREYAAAQLASGALLIYESRTRNTSAIVARLYASLEAAAGDLPVDIHGAIARVMTERDSITSEILVGVPSKLKSA